MKELKAELQRLKKDVKGHDQFTVKQPSFGVEMPIKK